MVKKEEIAYLLKIQFHFEIDALNMVSATFENHQNIFYFIGDYRHETLNMFLSYHSLDLITFCNLLNLLKCIFNSTNIFKMKFSS